MFVLSTRDLMIPSQRVKAVNDLMRVLKKAKTQILKPPDLVVRVYHTPYVF